MIAFVVVLLLLAAHFSLTPFAPRSAGQAWLLWPFAADSKSHVSFVGGMTKKPGGSLITTLLAAGAGVGFLSAAAALIGALVPPDWWREIVIAASGASLVLFLLYAGRLAILPIVLDLVLLWGVLIQGWSPASLTGS